jgi:hypothetical protein
VELKTDDEKLLVRYLLRELSHEEMRPLEERLLSDDEYFEQLSAVENELIDSFVRKELSEPERAGFERAFLVSPPRRERVEFARALLSGRPEIQAAVARSQEKISFWGAVRAFFAAIQPAARFSLSAAALFLVAGGSYLVVETFRLRSQLVPIRRGLEESQAAANLARELERQRQLSAQLGLDLERDRRERNQLSQELQRLRQGPSLVASFVLTPGLLRAEARSKRLVVPRGASSIRIQLVIGNAMDYSSFRAAITTVEGNEIWSGDQLNAQTTHIGKAIVLNIPAKLFSSGDYIIELWGTTKDRHLVDLESYQFSVVKR